jgi:hypothetical protein
MSRSGAQYARDLRKSGLSIYDAVRVGDPDLWIPEEELETLLDAGLRGVSVQGLPIKTRSKIVKSRVCTILGYPIPSTFKKTKPRFLGQNFDTYVQKSNNLQVWNEELSPSRRYVLIRVSVDDVITKVRVIDGETLALLDTTGTLTQKYQATIIPRDTPSELIVRQDTANLTPVLAAHEPQSITQYSPIDHPACGEILPISTLFERLVPLVGRKVVDAGRDQERNRGGAVHALVCRELGYRRHADDGRFPDIRNQLLEIKLQTARTIDLGLVCPDSTEPLDTPMLNGQQIRHCDVRYGIFYGTTNGAHVTITNFYLTTGEAFFTRFRRFEGKVLNRKLQIPLPADFFQE